MTLIAALVSLAAIAVGVVALRRADRVKKRVRVLTERAERLEAQLDRSARAAAVAGAEAALLRAGRESRLPLACPSQFGEDAFLFDLFERRLEGYFIEVGAYDGFSLSPTYFLEACGWSGLLVEPIPERFEQCRARRPHARVVNAAVGKRGASGTVALSVARSPAAGAAEDDVTDMASSVSIGEGQQAFISRRGGAISTITVPLTSLGALLGDAHRRVDVAVIDVEGLEIDVLDGLELERTRPRVLLVEVLAEGGDERLAAFLGGAGYGLVTRLGHNEVWVRRDEATLLRRAQILAGGPGVRGELISV